MSKNIAILGSTGSIGCNVLKLVQQFPARFNVVGLAAGRNIGLLRQQISTFAPELVSVADEELAAELVADLPAGWEQRVVWGEDGNEQVASLPAAEMVVSAIVGAAGLLPTLTAIRAGKDVGLANKETLVMAGDLVMEEVRRHQVAMLPIDSEHSAISQALAAGRRQDVAKIILTASGGPFLEKSVQQLWEVTPAEALAHPNWAMGNKISIDSATMMNKGLEVIEARWLFDMEADNIEVLVHPQSIVHSLVEFVDGSIMAQLGIPDMRIPISHALAWPERLPVGLTPLKLSELVALSFMTPDLERFPGLRIAYDVCRQGGTKPAVFNAANEVAVAAFLAGRLRFPEIFVVVEETVAQIPHQEGADLQTILDADQRARTVAAKAVGKATARLHKQRDTE